MGTRSTPSPTSSDLLALSVHEFRTPVSIVSGYLRMLLRDQAGPLNDRQRRLLEETEKSCARLTALVGQMSELANLEAGATRLDQQPVRLFELVGEVASTIQEGTDRGVRLEMRRSEEEAIVLGDAARLRTALTSLLHATLREKAEPIVVCADCSISSGSNGRWATVAVGEANAISSLLLTGNKTRPARFDELRGGVGLTLPIARRVIEAHRGRMWSLSNGERGAVALALPVHEQP